MDVDNPLLGERGASAVFGPQKGATDADVATLDRALGHFADLTAKRWAETTESCQERERQAAWGLPPTAF